MPQKPREEITPFTADLDPLRSWPASLRRRCLRDHADCWRSSVLLREYEFDMGSTRRQLSQRPLQDGRPTRPSLHSSDTVRRTKE